MVTGRGGRAPGISGRRTVWTSVSRPGVDEARLLDRLAPRARARQVMARTANGDGVMLRLLEGGAGRPVVLLHGRGHAATTFAPMIEALVDRHRVIAIDLPGFGHSAAPPFDARASSRPVDFFVAPARSLIAELGPEAVLVGHSLGGLVALEIALDAPLAGLVLINAMGLTSKVGLGERLYFHAGPERLARVRRTLGMGDRSTELGRLREELLSVRGGRPEASRAFEALVPWRGPIHERLADLPRLTPKTLLVWGARDETFPVALAREAERRIPGARLAVIDAGHSPHVERPEAVIEAVSGFLDGLGPADARPTPTPP